MAWIGGNSGFQPLVLDWEKNQQEPTKLSKPFREAERALEASPCRLEAASAGREAPWQTFQFSLTPFECGSKLNRRGEAVSGKEDHAKGMFFKKIRAFVVSVGPSCALFLAMVCLLALAH